MLPIMCVEVKQAKFHSAVHKWYLGFRVDALRLSTRTDPGDVVTYYVPVNDYNQKSTQ